MISESLDCAGNLAAAEATGAYVDAPRGPVHYGFDAFYVWLPCPIGTTMRVTYLDAKRNALIANFTLCHLLLHLLAIKLNKQLYYNSRLWEEMQVIFYLADVFLMISKNIAKYGWIV